MFIEIGCSFESCYFYKKIYFSLKKQDDTLKQSFSSNLLASIN